MKEIRPRMTPEDYELWQKFKGEASSSTVPNDYKKAPVLSALSPDGTMMDIDAYCEYHNLPREDVSSYKLVSHTGVPFYNIVFREQLEDFDVEGIRDALDGAFAKSYTYRKSKHKLSREAVLKWSDLHFGAHIRGLVLTPDFDDKILFNGLMRSVDQVNLLGFKKVHLHITGDLIESFSGLNHVNSWMSMDKDQTGAKAVILCVELLDKVLSKIRNLGEVKIVAGNHDRISKANDEDVKGGAAELISWGLSLKGYSVEFHPLIIRHKVGRINHINLHGHFGVSKMTTEKILWKYGRKGCFNYISEGHLHSIIQKLSSGKRKNFLTVKDDAIDHRRSHLPPMFTGNYYSESLGYDTNAGYEIVWDSGTGKPTVMTCSI